MVSGPLLYSPNSCKNLKPHLIRADWDPEARVWVATSDDVPGLATEADTLEALSFRQAGAPGAGAIGSQRRAQTGRSAQALLRLETCVPTRLKRVWRSTFGTESCGATALLASGDASSDQARSTRPSCFFQPRRESIPVGGSIPSFFSKEKFRWIHRSSTTVFNSTTHAATRSTTSTRPTPLWTRPRQLGASRFQFRAADGQCLQVEKHLGQWSREDGKPLGVVQRAIDSQAYVAILARAAEREAVPAGQADPALDREHAVCDLLALRSIQDCRGRPNFDHPCRLNIDQGWKAASSAAVCG